MTESPPLLEVVDLAVSLGEGGNAYSVLKDINLTCSAGEILAIIGPSGAGKTTLLRVIAGLVPQYSGVVRLNGVTIRGPGRERGLVFQDYALYPWLTVRGNIEFGLRAVVGDARLGQDTDRLLIAMGLQKWGKAYPLALSGGMRQRLAIARTLAARPSVLLLDEPFAALDAVTRLDVQGFVQEVHAQLGQSIVLVTHNVEEAVLLADRILILDGHPGSCIFSSPVELPRTSPSTAELRKEHSSLAAELLRRLRERPRTESRARQPGTRKEGIS